MPPGRVVAEGGNVVGLQGKPREEPRRYGRVARMVHARRDERREKVQRGRAASVWWRVARGSDAVRGRCEGKRRAGCVAAHG